MAEHTHHGPNLRVVRHNHNHNHGAAAHGHLDLEPAHLWTWMAPDNPTAALEADDAD